MTEEFDKDPLVNQDDRDELRALAGHLTEQRPVPGPAWRSRLRATLVADSQATAGHVQSMVLASAASGLLLMVVAAAGLVGIGPFSA